MTALGIFSVELVDFVREERERRVLSDFRHVLRGLREIRAQVSGACNRLELALEDIAAARRWSLADGQLAAYHAQLALQRVGEAAEALREAARAGGPR